jgi:hypothetical protein
VHVAVIDGKGNMAALIPSGGWISNNEVIPSPELPGLASPDLLPRRRPSTYVFATRGKCGMSTLLPACDP